MAGSRVNAAGFMYFTDVVDFKSYVESEIVGLVPDESRLAPA
jgi:hypothetical protein